MRAQIQAENLKDPDKARELLKGIAERSDSSDPDGPARRLELEQDRLDEAAAVVAQIRGAMEGGRDRRHPRRPDRPEARQDGRGHRALQRGPRRRTPTTRSSSTGRPSSTAAPASVAEATRALEEIVRDKPVKEVDTGTTLLVRGPVGAGRPLAPDPRLRRRDPAVRGAQAEQPDRHALPRATAGS